MPSPMSTVVQHMILELSDLVLKVGESFGKNYKLPPQLVQTLC